MYRVVVLTALVFGCSNNALPTENNSSGGTSGGTTSGTTGGGTNGSSTGSTGGTTAGSTTAGSTTAGTTNGGTTAGTTTGGGNPGDPCKTACDCTAGLACFQNACVKSPMGMLYCCDDPTGACPAGSFCQGTDGQFAMCGAGTSTTGTTGSSGCKTACDCPTGEACFMNGCVKPPQGMLYCCDNGTCPSTGGFCQGSDGSFMMCGGGGPGGMNGGMNGGSTGTANMCTTVACKNNADCTMAGCNNGCRTNRGTCR